MQGFCQQVNPQVQLVLTDYPLCARTFHIYPTSSHSFPSAFKPVTGSFATYILVEHLGRVNRAKTQTGGDEARNAAQV